MTTKSPPPANRGKTKSPTKDLSKQQSAAPIRLKTVVRRLPPNLPEAVFWQSVQPWVTDETASWKIFYQGKFRKKLNKENIPSRAYVLFKHEEQLAAFSREYDGHVFRDKQGNESQAVVEFAPNQKAPPEKKKVDSRHATIQQDEDYLSFIASLQSPPPKPVEVDVDALLASTLPPEEPKTTPLLNALREQKQSAQEKKLAISEPGKSHSRKGGAAAASAQKQEPADSPPTGKKGKKGKATQASGTAPPAPTAANPTSTKSGGGGRNRPNPSQASGPSTSSAAMSSAAPPTAKEAVIPADGEQSQRRNRPMLGLQSRHLKAALSGAGVQVVPAAPSSPSLASPVLAVPASNVNTGTPAGPSNSVPRGPRGRGVGEKRSQEQSKDGTVKEFGGGRGGGKEKTRSRHASGPPHAGAGGRTPDATPRILSRQEPPPSAFTSTEAPPKGLASPGELQDLGRQDPGSNRGRGGRRGRGQP